MSSGSSNWIFDKIPVVSLNDKVRELIAIRQKLVKVQADELDRIKILKNKDNYVGYINYLYNSYIVLQLPKTYLQ